MFKFYTAIGQLFLIRDEDGVKKPVVKWDNKVFELSKFELIVWSSLMWHICDYDELFEVFKEKLAIEQYEIDENLIMIDFNRTLDRLISRNIVVMSEDKVDILSVYNLISNLSLKVSTANFFISSMAFLKFIFIDNIPFSKAKKVFVKDKLSKNEKTLLNVIKKNRLQTHELITILNVEKGNKEISLEYIDEVTLQSEYNFGVINDVLQTICSLYLRKLIQFE